MAVFDTIAFPEPDWVTGFPTIDGWTGNTDPGVTASFPEPGYATAGRITYAGGAAVAPVVFHAMHANISAAMGLPVDPGPYLVMGFFCTFDPTFDDADGVTIALLPDFATKTHTTARRIDLLPLTDGVGAGPSGGGVDPIPGQAVNYNARLNRDLAAGITCLQGIGANPAPPAVDTRWQSIGVKNVHAKAASWHPSTVSTNAQPGQTVPTTGPISASPPFTLQVVDVSQFPNGGDLLVPISGGSPVTVAYTGRNTGTNTFTGCTVRKSTTGGGVDTGTAIQFMDLGWSVEVLIPATKALGKVDPANDNWIDLQGHFGIYVNLFRFSVWQPQPPATPHAGFLAAQYRFPLPDAGAPVADQHYLTGALTEPDLYIGSDWYGRATIPAITGTNDALGVSFQNVAMPTSNVGARHPGSSALTQTIYGPGGASDNTLVAQIKNSNPGAGATNVTAEFRFGKFGSPPTAFAQWKESTAFGATPPTVLNLTAGGGGTDSGEVTSDWSRTAVGTVPPGYAGDTCLWCRLTSPDNVNFVQDGVRLNFYFVGLSEHSGDATISGSGYPEPESGSDHDFLLLEHVRSIVAPRHRLLSTAAVGAVSNEGEVGDGEDGQEVKEWYWLVETFRRTGLELTVGDATAEVIDPSPGEFGLIAQHTGPASDVVVTQLAGGGLKQSGRFHELRVPHNGEVTIRRWIGAGPAGQIKPPPLPSPEPWWLRFLRWLIALIRRLFGR